MVLCCCGWFSFLLFGDVVVWEQYDSVEVVLVDWSTDDSVESNVSYLGQNGLDYQIILHGHVC